MILFWMLPAAVAASLVLTWALRHYALARRLIDVPNARSSHQAPTPRGGGMAIVVSFAGCLTLLGASDVLSSRFLIALAGSGGLIALVGFLDDHYHLSRRFRFGAHFLAAAWALFWLQGMPQLSVLGFDLQAGWVINIFAAVYIVWLLNLYNFMDGIDGIASVEAITVCVGAVVLYLLAMPGSVEWIAPAALAAAVAGFLFWNFPPARIFMGDVGSGFIGLILAVLSIRAAAADSNLFWAWVILLSAFIVDASVTLIRRMFAGGGKYLQPHRSHAYQHAARRLGAHKTVSLALGGINLLWLTPLAIAVGLGWLDAMLGLLIACAPLVWLALHFGAGTDG